MVGFDQLRLLHWFRKTAHFQAGWADHAFGVDSHPAGLFVPQNVLVVQVFVQHHVAGNGMLYLPEGGFGPVQQVAGHLLLGVPFRAAEVKGPFHPLSEGRQRMSGWRRHRQGPHDRGRDPAFFLVIPQFPKPGAGLQGW